MQDYWWPLCMVGTFNEEPPNRMPDELIHSPVRVSVVRDPGDDI